MIQNKLTNYYINVYTCYNMVNTLNRSRIKEKKNKKKMTFVSTLIWMSTSTIQSR